MRLVDADKLDGYILTKHGESNKVLCSKSIADVPPAFDIEAVVKQIEAWTKVTGAIPENSTWYYELISIIERGGVK
jgi:hypothetical protein